MCSSDLADVDEQRAAVGDEIGRPVADHDLLAGGELAPRLVGDVLDARRERRPAMGAGEQPALAELVQVLADGLGGNLEAQGQFLDADAARLAGKRKNLVLSQ